MASLSSFSSYVKLPSYGLASSARFANSSGECFDILAKVAREHKILNQQEIGDLGEITDFRTNLACFIEKKSLMAGFKAFSLMRKPFIWKWFLRRAMALKSY